MVMLPFALLGLILFTVSSKLFGYFSFPQALAIGLLTAFGSYSVLMKELSFDWMSTTTDRVSTGHNRGLGCP